MVVSVDGFDETCSLSIHNNSQVPILMLIMVKYFAFLKPSNASIIICNLFLCTIEYQCLAVNYPCLTVVSMAYVNYFCSVQLICCAHFFLLSWYNGPVLLHHCSLIVLRNESHYFFLGPGAPQTLIQSCLTFGTFSYIIEKLNKQQPALALPPGSKDLKGGQSVLPPFTLPLPHDAMEGFSKFQNFLSSKFRGN